MELFFYDSFHGAGIGAGATADTDVSIDLVLAVALKDGFHGASVSAGAASHTGVSDLICHDRYLLYVIVMDCNFILSRFSENAIGKKKKKQIFSSCRASCSPMIAFCPKYDTITEKGGGVPWKSVWEEKWYCIYRKRAFP